MTGWRVAILACLGAMVFGYDTAWWSGVLGMPAFTSRYGTFNPKTKKYVISPALTSSGRFSLLYVEDISSQVLRKWSPNCRSNSRLDRNSNNRRSNWTTMDDARHEYSFHCCDHC